MLSTVMQRAAAGNLVTIPPIFPSSSWRDDRYLMPPIGTFQFGMYIPTSADSSINRGSATMETSEARFKKTYDLANIYYSTASITSSVTALISRINNHLTAGRIPRVDFNFGPYVSKGNTISATTATYWRDVASGNYDNDYTADDGTSLRGIRYVLNRVLAVNQRLIVTLHHEADLKGETGGYNDQWYGNEADFRAMWQHIVILARTLVSQNNLLKEPVWFFNMAYDPKPGNTDTNKRKWGDSLTDIGSDGMYPGHNFVDRVGCDPYNGAAWSGHGNTWRSFGGTVNQFGFKDWWMSNFATGGARTQALASSGQGVYKPAMLGEFGTMERWASYTYSGSSGDGRDWLVGFKDFVSPGGGAYTTISDNETGTRDTSKPWLLAAIYFGRDYPSGPGSMYSDLSTATTSPQWGINPESPQKWAGLGDIAGASVFKTSLSSASHSGYNSAALDDDPVMLLSATSAVTFDDVTHRRVVSKTGSPVIGTAPDGSPCLVLDGRSQYFSVPDADDLSITSTGQLTVELVMRPDSIENIPGSETSGDGPICYPLIKGTSYGTDGDQEWLVRFYDKNSTRPNRISGYVFNPDGGLGAGSYTQEAITPGTWVHIAVVFDTVNTGSDGWGVVRMYRNGILKDTDSFGDPYFVTPVNGSSPLYIGARPGRSYFPGAIAKVAVFSTALSSARILAHASASLNT